VCVSLYLEEKSTYACLFVFERFVGKWHCYVLIFSS